MRFQNPFYYLALLTFLSLFLTGCQAIADIFKAGMGFGIFLVLTLIVGAFFLISRMGRK